MPRVRLLAPVLLIGFALGACEGEAPTANPDPLDSGHGADVYLDRGDGPCEIEDRSFDGNVEVGDGNECRFTNVVVDGNLFVGAGSALVAREIDVDGNIQGRGADQVQVHDSWVDGNIQLERGSTVDLHDTVVEGNVELEGNTGSIIADRNRIDGDLQAFGNRGGPLFFADNTIDGNLQCKENDPVPEGGGNVVDGNKEDQCSAL